ncbi:LysR family transcriptional regulator [Paracidovorax avenae]|uniref:LysR family transcriptional regulator n=1 Tax=Paracidovorax avenae TaxID=80867 RepID=UPI000D210636|nr:LysR family transcriptional regulator [Paracidovorax avenae]AVT04658.1 LysR family transcriptional regulator [Paracidovorax avenae]
MQFRLRQMEMFRAVMLAGSIKGAAKLLAMSQPAVSRGIAHTEQCLGYPLFDRVKGRLCPTEEAKALIAEVESCYLHALQVNDLAARLRNGSAGSLNICSSACLSNGLTTRAILRFLESYPKVQIQLRVCTLAEMPHMLLSNQVDLAIALLPLEHVNLEVEVVASGRMVCVVPTDHPLASQEMVSLQDLSRVPVISLHPGNPGGQLIEAALDELGISLNVCVHIWQTNVACALAAAGSHVALVDEFTAQELPPHQLRILPLVEDISLTPAVVRSALGVARPYIAPFINALKEQAVEDRIGVASSKSYSI